MSGRRGHFFTLCENRASPSNEVRLYIDTTFEVSPPRSVASDDDIINWLMAIGDLIKLTVDEIGVLPVSQGRRHGRPAHDPAMIVTQFP